VNIATRTFDGDDSLESLLGRTVVLDTAGSIIFLGTLLEVKADGFWLETADLRDKAEGHVSKERYICEAATNGVVSNRRRLFVFRHVVVSVSALEDVVAD
jgi:hypothetical protein